MNNNIGYHGNWLIAIVSAGAIVTWLAINHPHTDVLVQAMIWDRSSV